MPMIPAPTPPTSAARPSRAWLGLMGRRARFILVVVLVGVVASITRYGFDAITGWVTQAVYLGKSTRIIDAVSQSPWPLRVLIPAAGIVVSVLIARLLRTSGPSGVPDVMEVIALGGRPISLRNSLARTLSALATIGFGGSVGREGPIIHFASALSGKIGVFSGLSDERRRILIGCGTAAGLASAYGTPLSATLFVMEVIAGGFAVELLLPCLLASVSATLVLWSTGATQLGLYETPIFSIRNPAEIGIQAVLGGVLGVVAALFSAMHHWLPRLLSALRLPPLLLAIVGGLGVGACVAALPYVAGNGYYGIVAMLRGEIPWTLLATLALVKLVVSHLTVAAGGAGGLFTPTLFIGAGLGAFFGHFVQSFIPSASPKEAYAILGMAAMLAGTMRAPLLAVVMLVEMTRDVMIIPSLMVAVTFAVVTARLLKRESMYAEELRRRGIPWEGAIEERVLRALHVRDIMRTDVPRVTSNLPLASILDTFAQTGSIYVYVSDAEGKFLGVIDVREMAGVSAGDVPGGLVIASEMCSMIPSVRPEDPLADVNEKLWWRDYGQLPVVDADGKLKGAVTRRDLLAAVDREIFHRNVLLAKFVSPGHGESEVDFVELPSGHAIDEVGTEPHFVGRTLGEVNPRNDLGVTVLLIKRPRGDGTIERFSPQPNERLRRGDRLVVIGPRQTLQDLKNLE